MNKIFKILFVLLVSIFSFNLLVNAEAKETLKQAVEDEIKVFGALGGYEEDVSKLKAADLSDYKEDDKKINVYIFRGSTCPHCLDAIVYFAQNAKEYGKYYNIVSYEVWNNTSNNRLMSKVASTLGEKSDGVPFIVVGNKAYSGFSEDLGKKIIDQVIEMYNSNEKYDVFDHMEEPKVSNNVVIILVVLVAIVGVGFIVYVIKSHD